MKMGDIVNIQEDSRLRASLEAQRGRGFFNHFSNQSDNGALKKSIAYQEIDEDYPEKQQKLKKDWGQGDAPLGLPLPLGERGGHPHRFLKNFEKIVTGYLLS